MRKKITQRCQIHSPVGSILNKKVGKEFIPGLARFEESGRKSVEGREAFGCEERGRVNWRRTAEGKAAHWRGTAKAFRASGGKALVADVKGGTTR
jgi:hypothetical protein